VVQVETTTEQAPPEAQAVLALLKAVAVVAVALALL
jgi:hypothetical protein